MEELIQPLNSSKSETEQALKCTQSITVKSRPCFCAKMNWSSPFLGLVTYFTLFSSCYIPLHLLSCICLVISCYVEFILLHLLCLVMYHCVIFIMLSLLCCFCFCYVFYVNFILWHHIHLVMSFMSFLPCHIILVLLQHLRNFYLVMRCYVIFIMPCYTFYIIFILLHPLHTFLPCYVSLRLFHLVTLFM